MHPSRVGSAAHLCVTLSAKPGALPTPAVEPEARPRPSAASLQPHLHAASQPSRALGLSSLSRSWPPCRHGALRPPLPWDESHTRNRALGSRHHHRDGTHWPPRPPPGQPTWLLRAQVQPPCPRTSLDQAECPGPPPGDQRHPAGWVWGRHYPGWGLSPRSTWRTQRAWGDMQRPPPARQGQLTTAASATPGHTENTGLSRHRTAVKLETTTFIRPAPKPITKCDKGLI